MLCMTVFQSSTDICRRYIHYTELGRSDSVVFKCINISDVNIENFFEILGIQLSADIIFTAYSLYRGTVKARQCCFQVYKHFRHEYGENTQ